MLLTSRSPDLVACHFFPPSDAPQYERYELVPLNLFSTPDLDLVAAKMVSLARDLQQNGTYLLPNAGVFTDESYLDLQPWHIPNDQTYQSGHGNTSETGPRLNTAYETTPYQTDWNELKSVHGNGGTWTDYVNRYTYLTSKVQALVSATGMLPDGQAPYRIANSVYSGPVNGKQHEMPWYLEDVFQVGRARTYEESVADWRKDKRNVISAWCVGGAPAWANVLECVADIFALPPISPIA